MSTTNCTDSCFRIFNSDDINDISDIIMDMGIETRNVVIYGDSCDGNDG